MSERELRCLCQSYTWGIILYGLSVSAWRKREEFHRPLLGLCSCLDSRVNVQLEDQSCIDTAAAQSLHLQCINIDWHVAMHAMSVSHANLHLYPLPFINLQRLDLRWTVESIQNNLLHLLHASFYCISTFSQSNAVCAFLPTEPMMFTYLKVVLPCSYCSQLLILESSVFPTARITPGSAVLWLPPISAFPSPHYVV